MNERDARRHVRRELAEHARRRAAEPGIIGDPDDRARIIAQYSWAADYLAPGQTEPLPPGLRPLVYPDGTPLEVGPPAPHDSPEEP